MKTINTQNKMYYQRNKEKILLSRKMKRLEGAEKNNVDSSNGVELQEYSNSLLLSLIESPLDTVTEETSDLNMKTTEKRNYYQRNKEKISLRRKMKRLEDAEKFKMDNKNRRETYNIDKFSINLKKRLKRRNLKNRAELLNNPMEEVKKFWSIKNLEMIVCACCDVPKKKSK